MRILSRAAALAAGGLLLVGGPVAAQSDPGPDAGADRGSAPAEDAAPPPVSLDNLLRLPSGAAKATQPTRGGITRKGWQQRFAGARAELDEARARLARFQQELEALAADVGSYQVSAPGGGTATETGPLSYAKRAEIRQAREDVAAAEKALEELRVEASLAGVPAAWTEPPDPPSRSGSGSAP